MEKNVFSEEWPVLERILFSSSNLCTIFQPYFFVVFHFVSLNIHIIFNSKLKRMQVRFQAFHFEFIVLPWRCSSFFDCVESKKWLVCFVSSFLIFFSWDEYEKEETFNETVRFLALILWSSLMINNSIKWLSFRTASTLFTRQITFSILTMTIILQMKWMKRGSSHPFC